MGFGDLWEAGKEFVLGGNLEKVAKAGVDIYTRKRQVDQVRRRGAGGPPIVMGGVAGPEVYGPSRADLPIGDPRRYRVEEAGILSRWLEEQMGRGAEYARRELLPEWAGGYGALGQAGEIFEGGAMATPGALQVRRRAPVPGGIYLGQGTGLFHTTAAGYRLPNKLTLVKDADSNRLGFFLSVVPDRFKVGRGVNIHQGRRRHSHP